MKNEFRKIVLLLIYLTGVSTILFAQANYKIAESKEIEMKLSGTSTLHDWVMNTNTVSGEAKFDFMEGSNSQLTSLESLSFSLIVQNLKSDSKGLDKNAYKALKTNKYKNIFYLLTTAIISPISENKYLLKTEGELTVAGVTKKIYMDVNCLINANGTITCNGKYKLNMTDYHVKPPSFMFGAMKTGDAITLDFNMVYIKQPKI